MENPDLPGNAVYAPWPVTDVGSAVCAAAWGVVVVAVVASFLRPLLVDQPSAPSMVSLAAAVAVGGYVPFALADGFTTADPQNGATLPAIVLTSVLVRFATWRAEASPASEPSRTRRWPVALAIVAPLCVVVPWAALHPLRVGDLVITDSDGSSETAPTDATRTLALGAGQRIDLAIETVATVRLLDVRPVLPAEIRAVATRNPDERPPLPRELHAGDWSTPRFRVTFRSCDTAPVRVDAVRVRFERWGRRISQTLPMPTPLTLRCERPAR